MARYLRTIRADSYGSLEGFEAGPFGEGLNVVYGPNEAGKSTLASLVDGVLFGWEQSHGVHNTYTPESGVRSGALVFEEPGERTSMVSRCESEVQGDTSVISDIDRETYRAIFAFSSDELRSLRSSSDVTARLLSAESGTATSPAGAYVEIEQRIAALTSRAPDCENSVFNLENQLEAKRLEVKAALDQTELYLQEDHELRELSAARADVAQRTKDLDRELSDLVSWHAELAQVNEQSERCQSELELLRDETSASSTQSARDASKLDKRLLVLDSSDERSIRDRLDEFAERKAKAERVTDTAKENSAASRAAFEALKELDADDVARARSLRNHTTEAAVSVMLPLVFIGAGIPLFVHGRQIASLSFTALGIGLVVLAFFLAAAALVVLFRPQRGAAAIESRRQDAQWVMLQDKKKLDASLEELNGVDDEIRTYLESVGLGAADASIRQALVLLDEAADQRAAIAAEEQRIAALDVRIGAAEAELARLASRQREIAEAARLAGLSSGVLPARLALGFEEQVHAAILPDADTGKMASSAIGALSAAAALRELDDVIREKSSQREALVTAASGMGERFGELSRELEYARCDRSYDQVKLEYHEIRTRLREAKHELVSLLLAQRMLERSIATWESQSQPEVYAQASRLLSIITNGVWVKVGTSRSGSLVAVDANGVERDPRHLSLGTSQQLYLALRIALLIVAEHVGSAIPVVADDVLVNFDTARRQGAACALAELSRHRQVIVFSCHASTVEALSQAEPSLTTVSL